MLTPLIAAVVAMVAVPPDSSRCRCAQLGIDRYFASAEVVFIGRAIEVREVAADDIGPDRLEVRFTPLHSATGTFKGSFRGLRLMTPISSAACGVPVDRGADYVIFASRQDSSSGVAWFDTCSGSRPFVDRGDARLFIGHHHRDVVPALVRLAASRPAPQWRESFHTSPECWREPRIYHQGTLPIPIWAQTTLSKVPVAFPDVEGVVSPNRAYRAWALPLEPGGNSDTAIVLIDVERPTLLRIEVVTAMQAPVPIWISEKLLFLRIAHGRVQFTDLLIDVEQGALVYQESARYGELAFSQFQQACRGQCPCPAGAPNGGG